MSCSRAQHGAACGGQTQDLSIRSPMLYHYATALQHLNLLQNITKCLKRLTKVTIFSAEKNICALACSRNEN